MTSFEAIARVVAILEAAFAKAEGSGDQQLTNHRPAAAAIESSCGDGATRSGSKAAAVPRGAGGEDSGDALFEALVAPLRRMTEIQAAFDPAVRARQQGGGYVAKGSRARLEAAGAAQAAAGAGPAGGGGVGGKSKVAVV
jgi:hypothetical protein